MPASAPAVSFATPGPALRPLYPHTSTTKQPRASCRRLAPPLTSKLPRAATTPAPSASSPIFAANSVRAVLSPSSPKPSSSLPAAFARSPSSARTPLATAKISASATASPPSSTGSPGSRISSGSAFSTPIPIESPGSCLKPLRSTITSANISTCLSSTPRPMSSSA